MVSKDGKDFKFKIVLLGEGAVGKSSLVLRYCENKFKQMHVSTIQASFQKRTITVDECKAELNIWDTAGQEKYHALGPIYYRGSNGVLLIFDITDRRSFDKVKMWMREIKTSLGDSAELMIIGNKLDLEHQRNVAKSEAEEYAKGENALYMETSAMENIGISEAFEELTIKMIEHWREHGRDTSAIGTRSIQLVADDDDDEEPEEPRRRRKCCT
ncbi:unnamed protein product [Caenorhabditis bovis]|uniref:Ras-related protein Rab-21 n=1 Tax=Caenorhabditis bovis TaxID=2654633 RepID=A0A8S1EVR3_9PELO|nr:unnamed protein product [Caenorhabditis bovis]